jgi:hypothetical protein
MSGVVRGGGQAFEQLRPWAARWVPLPHQWLMLEARGADDWPHRLDLRHDGRAAREYKVGLVSWLAIIF